MIRLRNSSYRFCLLSERKVERLSKILQVIDVSKQALIVKIMHFASALMGSMNSS